MPYENRPRPEVGLNAMSGKCNRYGTVSHQDTESASVSTSLAVTVGSFLDFKESSGSSSIIVNASDGIEQHLNTPVADIIQGNVCHHCSPLRLSFDSDCDAEQDQYRVSMLEQADDFYKLSLLARAFRAMQTYNQNRGEKHILRLAADLYFRKQTLQACFHIWTWRLLTKSELSDPLLSTACAHHRRWMLRHYWRRWSQRVFERKRFRALCAEADQFQPVSLNRHLLSLTFSRWLNLIRHSQNADQFHRRRMISVTFTYWRSKAQLAKEYRCQERVAVAYHKMWQQKYWFQVWRKQVRLKQQHLAKIEERIREHQLKSQFALLKSTWTMWREYILVCQKNECVVVEQIRQSTLRLLSVAFHHWHDWTVRQQELRQLVHAQQAARNKKVLHTLIIKWHEYSAARSVRRNRVRVCFESTAKLSRLCLLQQTFQCWRDRLRMQWKIHTADRFASRSLLQRSLQHWKLWHMNNIQKANMYQSAVRFHEITVKFRIFTLWSDHYKQEHRLQQLESLAHCRWSCCLQARAWSAWSRWSNDRRQKRVLFQTASNCYRRRKLGEILLYWHGQASSRRLQRQAVFCRHFWNSDFRQFNVAYKAARHWYRWTMERRVTASQEDYSHKNSTKPLPAPVSATSSAECLSLEGINVQKDPTFPSLKSENITQSTLMLSKPQCPDFLLPYLHSQGVLDEVSPMVSVGSCSSLPNHGSHAVQSFGVGSRETLLTEQIELLKNRIYAYVLQRQMIRLETTLDQSLDSIQTTDKRKMLRNERRECRERIHEIMRLFPELVQNVPPGFIQ